MKTNWKRVITSKTFWLKVGSTLIPAIVYLIVSGFSPDAIAAVAAIVVALIGYAIADECKDKAYPDAATFVIAQSLDEAVELIDDGEKAPLITNAKDINYNKEAKDELCNGCEEGE